MKIRNQFLILAFAIFSLVCYAQDEMNTVEMKAKLAEKQAALGNLQRQVDTLEGEIATISADLVTYPYWDKGSSGLIGLDLNSFRNWATRGTNLNSSATNLGMTFNGFANKTGENDFWRNNGSLVLGWQNFSKGDGSDGEGFQKTADIFNIQSLYGRNLTKTLALSTLGEFRTTLLENSFDPAYLDIGVGFTWLPTSALSVVLHPLNYNIVIASEESNFNSSLGSKLVANYSIEIAKGISWRSNFSGFLSYGDVSLESNYTWTNGLNFSILNGIGVGIEYAMRQSKQETVALPDDFQSYFILGLSYTI